VHPLPGGRREAERQVHALALGATAADRGARRLAAR
jgi:hypothetical protein